MNILLRLIIIVLLLLIKIGDGILYAISLVSRNAYHVFFKRLSLFLAIRKSIKKRYAPFPTAKTPHKKIGRTKPVVVFSFHLPFFIKLKYFLIGCLFSGIFIFMPLLSVIFLQELPNPKSMSQDQFAQTTKIYDRNGTLLYQIYANQNRTIISLDEVPKFLQDATIAIEDKDFYLHPGFDITAIIRSSIANISGRDLQGGSTITQQLIKSALLSPQTSVSRKFKEVILAFWAERMYTKKQILQMYFNQIPYGGTAWGVEAASQTYFGKHVKDLTLAESAFLAGIPRAPTIYSPYGETPNLWKKRQQDVLYRMRTFKYITDKQVKDALSEELTFKSPRIPLRAPHFVMYIRNLLIQKYGLSIVEKGGLTVITSLDLKLQEAAQKIVSDEISNDAYLNLTNGATLVTSPKNGDILAMVGSRDFSEITSGNVNLTTALRQPGSSIKIVTYAAALSNGFTAATLLDDSPITFASTGRPSYSPVNYDGKFHGKVPLRVAFANSFNIPAVKTLNQIGIATFLTFGKRLGIKTWGDINQYGLSITLGSAETTMVDMATVYGVFANSGERVDINPFLKVTDYKGSVLEEKTSISKKRVIDEGIAFIISNILSDNQARAWEFGTNSPLQIPHKTVSVKTGTSDNKRDNWTIGYTPSYLVAVWVGNNDNSPMSQALASGITGAAPIWNKVIHTMLSQTPDEKLNVPSNIVKKSCGARVEYFVKGTENSVNCNPPPPSPSPKP